MRLKTVGHRDYERNVRQARRDLDNLRIALDHIKATAEKGGKKDGPLSSGPAADFVKRAVKQLKDGYRTIDRDYPKRPSMSRRLEYATHPGAEMHLLDIGKEANQTARTLNDLLSELRFASLGGDKGDKDKDKEKEKEKPRQMAQWEEAVSDSPRSSSPNSSVFSRSPVRPSSVTSPVSSARSSGSSHRHRSRRSTSVSQRPSYLIPSQPLELPLGGMVPTIRHKEQALDNLQDGIDLVMSAYNKKQEGKAMEYLEHSIKEVLKLQRNKELNRSHYDADVGDAVEELDYVLKHVADAETDDDDEYSMQQVASALEDVENSLQKRQRHQRRMESRDSRPLEHHRVSNLSHGGQRRERRYSVQ